MIGFLDTFTLARTKLRSKRILLIVTVIISGLLFGVLVGALIIVTGATQSATKFFEATQHGRYLVDVQPYIPQNLYSFSYDQPSRETIAELQSLEKDYVAKQKALFQQQKLPFDPATIPSILTANPFNSRDENGVIFKTINQESPVYPEYIKRKLQRYIKTAPNTIEKITERSKRYGATAVYTTAMLSPTGGTMTYLPDGKERLDKKPSLNNASMQNSPYSTNVKQATYVRTDRAVINRFIFPPNAARTAHPGAVPVVLNTAEIVDLFGKQLDLSPKPTEATKQADWYKTLYQKANGLTYTYCYRSQGERDLIQKTMQTNTDLVEKKNDPTYQPPDLQYNLPTETCGPLTVKRDTRSTEQKSTDTKQETIQKELGTYKPLERKLFTFQIVGAFNLTDFTNPDGPEAYVSLLLGATYRQGAFIPQQLYDALPVDATRDAILLNGPPSPDDFEGQLAKDSIKPAIVSFPTIDAARDFITNESCRISPDIQACTKGVFMSPYGTNYLAVEEFGNEIRGFIPWILGVVTAIATIIIWVTMARVIIDSRRETAVFRALGAKRRDIASVYLTYSMMVAGLIAVFAFVLGLGLAFLADRYISAPATAFAQVAYGTFDTAAPAFHVIGFDISLLALLAGAIILISLIAVTPPLIRNVRRSPIRDMRDE